MMGKTNCRCRIRESVIAWAAVSCAAGACSVAIAQEPARPAGPPVVFSAPLPDVPGKNLEVVELSYRPNSGAPSTADSHGPGHRHPGSVLVYVLEGSVRLAIEGQPPRVVHAGETFFEPPGAHHIINENASATEPARAIAIMIVPEGASRVQQ